MKYTSALLVDSGVLDSTVVREVPCFFKAIGFPVAPEQKSTLFRPVYWTAKLQTCVVADFELLPAGNKDRHARRAHGICNGLQKFCYNCETSARRGGDTDPASVSTPSRSAAPCCTSLGGRVFQDSEPSYPLCI